MEIKRSGSQPSAKGPAEWFTGTVRIDPLFHAPVPARAVGAVAAARVGAWAWAGAVAATEDADDSGTATEPVADRSAG